MNIDPIVLFAIFAAMLVAILWFMFGDVQ